VAQLMAIAAQGTQPVAGRTANITEFGCGVEHVELALGNVLEFSPPCGTNAVVEELFDARLCKASDHCRLSGCVNEERPVSRAPHAKRYYRWPPYTPAVNDSFLDVSDGAAWAGITEVKRCSSGDKC